MVYFSHLKAIIIIITIKSGTASLEKTVLGPSM